MSEIRTRTEDREPRDGYESGALLQDEHGFFYTVMARCYEKNTITVCDMDECRSMTRSLDYAKAYLFPVDQTPGIFSSLIDAEYIADKSTQTIYKVMESITTESLSTGSIKVRIVDSINTGPITLSISEILNNASNYMAFKEKPHVEILRQWANSEVEGVTSLTFNPGNFDGDGLFIATTPTGG